MIWQENIECMSTDEMCALQTKRLKKLADTVYKKVKFYKDAFDEKGVSPKEINKLEDI